MKAIMILRSRGVYNEAIWSYSLRYKKPEVAIRDYLSVRLRSLFQSYHFDDIPFSLHYIESPIYSNHPVDIPNVLSLLEYRPLINPRTFKTVNIFFCFVLFFFF
jgi:hypothetical protein